MPWLVGTALIHSLAVTEKRGSVQELDGAARDRRVLAVAARHVPGALGRADLGARVRDRSRARHLHPGVPRDRDRRLARAVRVARAARSALGGALRRRCRASRCCSPTTCCSSSRRRSVLLGTLYPLLLDALGLGKISVGPPYFDAVFVPLMAPLVFLMGVGPLARWRQARVPDLWTRLHWALVRRARRPRALLPFAFGQWTPLVALGLLLAAWIAAATVTAIDPAPARRAAARLRRQAARATPPRGTACCSRISASRCSSSA